VKVLRPGDTIVRVNGESIERPEAFKAVWDSLVDAKEIVLEIERDGQASKLHYTISG
jgi:type II secretory pathway component PulC